jgi:opacity protein-like surface antigen
MKKKAALLLALLVLAAGILAAQVSVGAGGYVGGDFGGGNQLSMNILGITVDAVAKTPYFGGGGFLFFDAKYVEFSLGFFLGGGTWTAEGNALGVSQNENFNLTLTNVSLSALGKYPVSISEAVSVFPLLGVDFLLFTSLKNKDSGDRYLDYEDFSSLWFKLGCGLDFAVSRQIYVRLEALYGLRLANQGEEDIQEENEELLEEAIRLGGSGEAKRRVGHGLTVRAAVGYTF